MSQKARLLFVDDEERVVNLLRLMFRGEYEVNIATSGAQALQILAERDVHVVVSDQRMPGMSGIELLAEVRRRWPATMRILLTGYSDLAAIVGSVNEGEVFRFVNKPWNHEEIKDIVAQAAEIAQSTGQAAEAASSDTGPDTSPMTSQLDDNPELLILDDSGTDAQVVAQMFAADYYVHRASSIEQALKILEQRDVGVVVAEAVVGGQDTGQLLRLLKQHYPAITTVMLTSAADADLVVKLINQAQIYRFATKPIRPGVFQLAVSAAMKEHRRCRTTPTLSRRYRVAETAEPENLTLASSVLRSLKGLRSRLSALLH